VIGIDFGTTNSCVAIDGGLYDPVRAVSLRPENTQPYDTVLASAVYDPFGRRPQLGRNAQQASRTRSRGERPPYLNYFKPHLDLQRLKERRLVPVSSERIYDGMQQNDREIAKYDWVEVGGEFSRAEIIKALAVLFDFLIAQAKHAGGTDETILFGTPVSFSSRSRKRMIAGLFETGRFTDYREILSRVRFVHEPVAAASAAMSAATDAGEVENVLVFDHGGGTLDLSLVRFERRDGFDQLVPALELAAGGADDVAGRAIDHALITELRNDAAFEQAFQRREEWEIQTFVEGTKVALSSEERAPFVMPNFVAEVERATLERAMLPILGRIEVEMDHVLSRAHLDRAGVDRVVMTGGSSLVPRVQEIVASKFDHLDEYHLRRYDPTDPRDVELAITEVAQGLVQHAQTNTLEHVVHWDVDLLTSEGDDFVQVAARGERFDRDADGRPVLIKSFPIDDANRDGISIGLYESQLDRDFIFGVADIPRQEGPISLEVSLRPDALFPRLVVRDASGNVLARPNAQTGWDADDSVVADLDELPSGHLEDFFDSDVEYLPDSRFDHFEHAPLCRRLKKDDYVEWTQLVDGRLRRERGVISRITYRGEHADLEEMHSWDLREYRFMINTGAATHPNVRPKHGYIRLATRLPQ
jgi:hypothetical protein